MPVGTVRLLSETPGRGRPVLPGDRIRVELIGRYANGEVWGQGPYTFRAGTGSYPDLRAPLQVGAEITMQLVTTPDDTTNRLHPFPGGDIEREGYQVRRDRGPIIIEHRVRHVCRPMKVFFLQTGFGPIEMELGCWPIPRARPRRPDGPTEGAPPDRGILDPPPTARAPADPSRYEGLDGLYLAAREGRPEVVGRLLRQGRDAAAADSIGFRPIHYVGWAQRPMERFVPALEQAYLDVVDTFRVHGAALDASVGPGQALAPTLSANEYRGQTALGFAADECADRLVRHLLAAGAKPDARADGAAPALTAAARNGCPETVGLLLEAGATVDWDPQGGGTPLERLIAVSMFHQGHREVAKLLIRAGARTATARERLTERLANPGPGGFGFGNRPMAREILALLRP